MFFFFNDTATTEIYTLSLHDALPIYIGEIGKSVLLHPSLGERARAEEAELAMSFFAPGGDIHCADRKSTRLNSSHANISYAVFCLKKKNHSLLLLLSLHPNLFACHLV